MEWDESARERAPGLDSKCDKNPFPGNEERRIVCVTSGSRQSSGFTMFPEDFWNGPLINGSDVVVFFCRSSVEAALVHAG